MLASFEYEVSSITTESVRPAFVQYWQKIANFEEIFISFKHKSFCGLVLLTYRNVQDNVQFWHSSLTSQGIFFFFYIFNQMVYFTFI